MKKGMGLRNIYEGSHYFCDFTFLTWHYTLYYNRTSKHYHFAIEYKSVICFDQHKTSMCYCKESSIEKFSLNILVHAYDKKNKKR